MGSISFIVPTYNEIQNLIVCIHRIETYAKAREINFEIIVIDSGSIDGTRERLEKISLEKDHIHAIFQDRKMGMGSALREAYQYIRYQYVCHYECDMPYKLLEIDRAIDLLDRCDCDFVLGHRQGGQHLIRKFYSYAYRFFLRIFFGSKFQTINFSYKVFDRKILDNFPLKSSGSFIDAELVLETFRTGFKIEEVPVPYTEREKGKSSLRFLDVLKLLGEAGNYAQARRSLHSPSAS